FPGGQRALRQRRSQGSHGQMAAWFHIGGTGKERLFFLVLCRPVRSGASRSHPRTRLRQSRDGPPPRPRRAALLCRDQSRFVTVVSLRILEYAHIMRIIDRHGVCKLKRGLERAARKRPVNLTLSEALVAEAKGVTSNLSGVVEALLVEFVSKERDRR